MLIIRDVKYLVDVLLFFVCYYLLCYEFIFTAAEFKVYSML